MFFMDFFLSHFAWKDILYYRDCKCVIYSMIFKDTDEVMTGIYFRYLRCCWMGVVILSSL